MLERAEATLAKRFEKESVPIKYRRGDESFALSATLGKTLFRTEDERGVSIHHESRDFIVRRADLNFTGNPEMGDEVIFIDRIFRVYAPNGEPCWKYRGRYSLDFIRIHTVATGRLIDE